MACVCTTEYDREGRAVRPAPNPSGECRLPPRARSRRRNCPPGMPGRAGADREACWRRSRTGRTRRLSRCGLVRRRRSGPGRTDQHQAPAVRIVVVAAAGGSWRNGVSQAKIFYYAVEPFGDNEIADILAAAFQRSRSGTRPSGSEGRLGADQRHRRSPIATATRSSCWRRRACCGAAKGWACRSASGCWHEMFPVVITPGEANLTPANILKTAGPCDRLMVLLAQGQWTVARQPGPRHEARLRHGPREAAGKVTTLAVQPDAMGGLAGLDARTTAALADHIVREMAAY